MLMWTALILFCLTGPLSLTTPADDLQPKPIGHPRVIADLSGCTTPYYTWVSRDRLLLLLGDTHSRRLTDIATVDLPKSLRRPVGRFRELWDELRRQYKGDEGVYVGRLNVSPDGHWLLFTQEQDVVVDGDLSLPAWKLFSLDDGAWSHPFGMVDGANIDPLWAPDSRHIVSLTQDNRSASIWTLGKPVADKVTALDKRLSEALTTGESVFSAWVSEAGRLFVSVSPRAAKTWSTELWELKSADEPEIVSRRNVSVPRYVQLISEEPARDGKLIAWVTSHEDSQGKRRHQIWVSDVDANVSHLLVDDIKAPANLPDDDGPDPWDVHLRWRPGTTQLSYNSAGKLWVVDAHPK